MGAEGLSCVGRMSSGSEALLINDLALLPLVNIEDELIYEQGTPTKMSLTMQILKERGSQQILTSKSSLNVYDDYSDSDCDICMSLVPTLSCIRRPELDIIEC